MSRFGDLNSDNSLIDQDNRARTDRLAAKLARLKNVAVDIEEETRDHIPMLDAVDDSYDGTFNAINFSQTKLTRLLRSNKRGRQLFCYTVLIVVAFIFFIHFWLFGSSS